MEFTVFPLSSNFQHVQCTSWSSNIVFVAAGFKYSQDSFLFFFLYSILFDYFILFVCLFVYVVCLCENLNIKV